MPYLPTRAIQFGDARSAEIYEAEVVALAASLPVGTLAVAPRWTIERTRKGTLTGGQQLMVDDLEPNKDEYGATVETPYERATRLLARGELVGRIV